MIWCFWHIQHQNRIDISFEWPIQEILSLSFLFFACSKKWIDSKDDLYNELKKEKKKNEKYKTALAYSFVWRNSIWEEQIQSCSLQAKENSEKEI